MNTIRFPDKFGKVFTKIISNEIPHGINIINAPKVWQYTKGEGVVVAVIDTGIDLNHPDLKDNIIDAVSLIDDDPQDGHGHGTHVAGTIAGRENNLGVVGVAPFAKILSIKCIPASGQGVRLPIPQAIEFAINWRGKNGESVRVINMSLGTSNTPELYNAIKKAVDSGIIVVCASGNDGDGNAATDELCFPGNYQEVVEVGAWNMKGFMAEFSNSNSQIDLVAPGVDIHSCFLSGQYATWSGTSMATPHIAGACALIIAGLEKVMKRKLTETEIYYALVKRARDLGLNRKLQGYGVLDFSLYLNEFITGLQGTPYFPEVYLVIMDDIQIFASESQSEAEAFLRRQIDLEEGIEGHVERYSDRKILFTYRYTDKPPVGTIYLTGESVATAEQMEQYMLQKVGHESGLAHLYLQEGEIEGIRGDIAFCQAVRDTRFFTFEEPDRSAGKHNYGRLHGQYNTPKDVSFSDERTGVRAHIQHLKAGANTEPLRMPCVDPFFNEVLRGSRPTLESLSGTWHVPGYNPNVYKSLDRAIVSNDAYHHWIIQRYEGIINTSVPPGYVAPNPFPKPEIPNEENEDMVDLLLVHKMADLGAANIIQYNKKCPIMDIDVFRSIAEKIKDQYKNIVILGTSERIVSKAKLLYGDDRNDTLFEKVYKYAVLGDNSVLK